MGAGRAMGKEVPYTFHDLEPDMGSPKRFALHPFDRVPILQHDRPYQTAVNEV